MAGRFVLDAIDIPPPTVTSVLLLLKASGPATVTWLVVPVVIGPVDLVLLSRFFTHTVKK
ncbi:MAG TPA: hypothetical protein ENK38_02000 [Gammaproteobacteria bacterium]|nr:hypothetical protein [Gammaproteobacteria bacterium]